MERERNLPQFWLLRRIRRWIIKPQKEIVRWQRKLHGLPFVVLPKFLRESKHLLELILQLKPDIVLGNSRSGSPYVRVIEHRLREARIEVRYERLCSAWGHKLHFTLKPAASVHWLHETLAKRKRIIMVDVSRKPFSDAQRIVGGVIVWLYNEVVSKLTGKPQPVDFVSSITNQMREYLRRQPDFKEAFEEVWKVLRKNMSQKTYDEHSVANPQFEIAFARHLLVRKISDFSWDDEHGCLLPINVSREAWIDDRTDKYQWLPFIARWFI
ncbi:MAG: hypothetical protein NZ937_05825 [Armatimonadetes bacterium]|nr:hypothetical protein [Armatimonadota bacterium]